MPLKQNEEIKEEFAVIPPDGGWGWIVLLCSFLCNLIVDGAIFTFGIFLESISKTFKVHPTTVGIGHSLLTGFSPFTCGIINHYGFRPVAFVGGLIAATAFGVSTVVTSIEAFIIIFGVFGGIGLGMIYLPTIVIVGYYFEKWRSLASSLSAAGSAVGIITFPIIVDDVMADFDWQTKFKFIMGGCLFCSLLALTYRPIKPRRNTLYSRSSMRGPSLKSMEGIKFHFQDCTQTIISMIIKMLNIKLMKSPSFTMLTLSVTITGLGLFVPYLFLKERGKEVGLDEEMCSHMFIALGIANVVGRIGSALATSIPGANSLNVSYVNITICGLATIISIFSKDVFTQFLYNAVFGLTSACIVSLRVPLVVSLLGLENLTNGFGLLMLFYGLATFLGAPIGGQIAKSTQSYNYAFIYAGCMFLISAILLMLIKLTSKCERRRDE
ncbi:MFS 1 domain containing protein [Asbolus verrucosus]|uniref:MFS 1 domain containing protein n=1 Tax=Asbolus verrucosus TaxID=1661398 RepID=A0A482VAW9_ASBVE|nr:MFS 1 domain containing protein [Asbolus verrucosus]